jgi:hypothetical protein
MQSQYVLEKTEKFTTSIFVLIQRGEIYPFIALSQRFGPSKHGGEKTTRHLITTHPI